MRARIHLAIAAASLAIPLGGCRPAEPPDDAPIRVAVGPWLTFAPFYIAEERGFYEAQGLNVELVVTTRGSHAIPLLLSGDLDVLPTPIGPGFFSAVAAGQRLRYVADKGWMDPSGCPSVALVVPRTVAAAGTLAVPGGRPRISMSKEGPMQLFVELALRRYGLSMADADLHHVPIAAELLGIGAGTLDGAVMTDPQLSQARREYGAEILVGMPELMPGFQFSMVAYGPRLLDRDRDLGLRFMIAYLQGVRAYGEGKTEDNLRALSAATGQTREDLAEMCWMPVRADGSVNLESLEAYRDWYEQRGWLSSPVPVEDVWDPSFIESANHALAARGAGEP